MRNFYAISDTFTGLYPEEATSGFANTTTVIAFDSKKARAEYLANTKLLKAKECTRRCALKYASKERTDFGIVYTIQTANSTPENQEVVILKEVTY